MSKDDGQKPVQPPFVSVVITCLNAADWLPGTIRHIEAALDAAGLGKRSEIVVVNDGSIDNSAEVVEKLAAKASIQIRLVNQEWMGRYLGRKAGVEVATGDYVLFIDTRVHLHETALKFVVEQLREHPERKVWNGHVLVAKKGNVIARFGDAITFIGWRRYFRHPKTTSYGLADFDYYPKGTGIFLVPRALLVRAMAEFETTTTDLTHSSDDTLLIRLIAAEERINLSPKFSATYYARTTLGGFVKHTYNRGQFFVDGFLRRGTRFFWPLIGVLTGCVVVVGLMAVWPGVALELLAIGSVVWLAELVIALMLGTPAADALSLFALTPLFAVVYVGGIWRAVIRRYARV